MAEKNVLWEVNTNNFSATEVEEDIIFYKCIYCPEEFLEPGIVRKHRAEKNNNSNEMMKSKNIKIVDSTDSARKQKRRI